MAKGKALWILFALMAISQMAIPAWMIKGQEDVLRNGTEFRFNTEPVDPYDLMRGKYITLSFTETRAGSETEYLSGDVVYVSLGVNNSGYAILKDASKEPPSNGDEYIELTLDHSAYLRDDSMHVYLPFDRFYMEESKAQAAEDLYRGSIQSVQNESHAVVMVLDGKAVLKDVMIDGVPIKEAVEALQSEMAE